MSNYLSTNTILLDLYLILLKKKDFYKTLRKVQAICIHSYSEISAGKVFFFFLPITASSHNLLNSPSQVNEYLWFHH